MKKALGRTNGDAMFPFIGNWIDGRECAAVSGRVLPKLSPETGTQISRVARSEKADVDLAVEAARKAQPAWAAKSPVARGDVLRAAAILLKERAAEFAAMVGLDAGKSVKDSLGEVGAAVEMGFFVAGEGRRFYGKSSTSAMNRSSVIVRQPMGVVGLIIAANMPIANVAWKAFPALLCGNGVIMKAAEDAPAAATVFAKVLKEAGLPDGVFNVIQGYGKEAGVALVEHPGTALISFTGSAAVGRYIQQTAGARLAKVCLELGGKNPLIVCDDADLDRAASAAVLSAFSNAGQRCATGSRMIVFDSVYGAFKKKFVEKTKRLKVGCADGDDLGAVINERQLNNMLAAVEKAKKEGARVLVGGERLQGRAYDGGFFMAPTIVEGASSDAEISRKEVFGPICTLYRVAGYEEAVALANDCEYGLTASIHTKDVDRAMVFLNRIQCGVAYVNGLTYGSEPHMPFGGVKNSGTGWREAGSEALDVYSYWKALYIHFDPDQK